ncbi:hypothetical protein [Halocalculus aciditolerans]|uniref:Uncharacterized protein n=1 Tax=Halocalculus aciditolerans TaxID=1383812 RepID=A0A830F5J4_9EURY|nr:hypothetical protein [Halocalculus aciditolerans]GGL56738.1 hypothetical protein GCM10009039_13620 [Halocalculus aciditolerans]
MDRFLAAGVILTTLGIGGYAVGVFYPYPGRGFTLTAVMVGITLLAVGIDWGEAA